MIVLTDISKSFDGGQTFAVKSVSLEVHSGETLVLLGSSGCGKTTTLKMINRLIEPTSGQIEVDGLNVLDHDVLELRRSIGYVFQRIGLFPNMTIEQNVTIVPKLLGWPRSRRREKAHELLKMVQLDPDLYAKRYPNRLSGGQRQRVAVARALAADPAYLLMEEPFGARDALTRDSLQQEMHRIKDCVRKTIVFVTHDIFEAITLGDRIAVMHQGRIEQVASREEILVRPRTEFVRDLFARPRAQLTAFAEASETREEPHSR